MNYQILPLHKLQEFEEKYSGQHIVIQYKTPGKFYEDRRAIINYSKCCLDVLQIYCHDLENPITSFNQEVIDNYPIFYRAKPWIFFSEVDAIRILHFVNIYKQNIELIVCQCDAGIARSSATAAALSKITNDDDSWVFDNHNYVPNMTIYKIILNVCNEVFNND